MGMSASQVRLLQLTDRKNDINFTLTKLSNEKVSLSNDSDKITLRYQEALNAKTFKWSNNNGASYIDLTYANLMKPSVLNNDKRVLLTDTSGRVVIDRSYLEYAKMISPNGAAGGDWESNKGDILSKITGIDADKINSELAYDSTINEKKKKLDELKKNEPSKDKFTGDRLECLLEKLNGVNDVYNWSCLYNSSGTVHLGENSSDAKNKLNSLLDSVSQKLSPYFMDNADKFKAAIENKKEAYSALLNSDVINTPLEKNGNNYTVNIQSLFDQIFSGYYYQIGSSYEEGACTWYDVYSDDYSDWVSDHAAWEAEYEKAKNDYVETVNNNNLSLDANEESLINFYNDIFAGIAENGWVYNEDINDPEYLNQMLQNNMFTLTSIDSTKLYDETNKSYYKDYDYTTNIASNCSNIFKVSDSAMIAEAQAEYEYQKSLINKKETRIDTQMQNLETEQAAINQMIQSIQSQRDENIERNFSIMS